MFELFFPVERNALWKAQRTQDADKPSEQLAGRHSGLAGYRVLRP